MFDVESKTRQSFTFSERYREDECVRNVDRLKRVENVFCPRRKVMYEEKSNFRTVANGTCLISSFGNNKKLYK